MKDILKLDLEYITYLQENFVRKVINNIWNEDYNDYSIDMNNYGLVILSYMYIDFNDFIIIAKYEIPKDVVFEYYDDISLNYESEDMKAYKESIKDIKDFSGNLLGFYKFINNPGTNKPY